jgi:hypothetical protein
VPTHVVTDTLLLGMMYEVLQFSNSFTVVSRPDSLVHYVKWPPSSSATSLPAVLSFTAVVWYFRYCCYCHMMSCTRTLLKDK